MFSFLKSSKQDQLGVPALSHGDKLVTGTAEKAYLQNLQFQSVFTTKAPLSLSRLCKTRLQDMAECDGIPSEALPAGMQESSPVMEDFDISVAGILKLLKNLKPWKTVLCKVLEHIMAYHLVGHLNKHDLLYDLQHGFREKRSCETQLIMLFEDLARNTPVNMNEQTNEHTNGRTERRKLYTPRHKCRGYN